MRASGGDRRGIRDGGRLFRIPVAALAVSLVWILGCDAGADSNQTSGRSVPAVMTADQLAEHIAMKLLLSDALKEARYTDGASAILADSRRSFEVAVALAVVLTYSEPQSLQQSTIELFNTTLGYAAAVESRLASNAEYIAAIVKGESSEVDVLKASTAQIEMREIEKNRTVTREIAARAVELSARLPASRSKEFVGTRDALKSALKAVLSKESALSAKLTEARVGSRELRESRDRVQALLRDAQRAK